MNGIWVNGEYVLASTLADRQRRLEKEVKVMKRKVILDKVLDLTHRERILEELLAKMTLDEVDGNVLDSIIREIARVNKEFEKLEGELHGSEVM